MKKNLLFKLDKDYYANALRFQVKEVRSISVNRERDTASRAVNVLLPLPPVLRVPGRGTKALQEARTLRICTCACPDIQGAYTPGGSPDSRDVLYLPGYTTGRDNQISSLYLGRVEDARNVLDAVHLRIISALKAWSEVGGFAGVHPAQNLLPDIVVDRILTEGELPYCSEYSEYFLV